MTVTVTAETLKVAGMSDTALLRMETVLQAGVQSLSEQLDNAHAALDAVTGELAQRYGLVKGP